MYEASAAFSAAIKARRDQRALILWGDDAILTGADISASDGGIKYTEYANPEEDITIGQTVQASIEFCLLNEAGSAAELINAKGKEPFAAYLGARLDDAPESTGISCAAGATMAIVVNANGANKIVVSANPAWGYISASGKQTTITGAVHALAAKDYSIFAIGADGGIVAQFGYAPGATAMTAETVVTPQAITKATLARWAAEHMCVTLEDNIAREYSVSSGTIYADKWEYVPLGVFVAERPSKTSGDLITVTAYDQMSLFERDATEFVSSISYPITLANLLPALCSYAGVDYSGGNTVNDSVSYSASTFLTGGYTLRNILSYIAAAKGGFARIDRDGNAEIAWFANARKAITLEDQFTTDIAEYTTTAIGGVTVRDIASDTVAAYPTSVTDDAQMYAITDNPLLIAPTIAEMQARAKPVYERLAAVSAYRPASIECVANWAIQAGDIVTIEGAEIGAEYAIPIFAQTITWTGFATAEIEATGSETRGISAEDNKDIRNGKRLYESGKEVNALKDRVTAAETQITQNKDEITLRATKTEVATAVSGVQADADANAEDIAALQARATSAETQIAQNASAITLRATKQELDGLQIGGVNLMRDTRAYGQNGGTNYTVVGALQAEGYNGFAVRRGENTSDANALQFKMTYAFQPKESYTLSFWAKGSGAAQALITGYTYPCTSVSSEGTQGTDEGGANTFFVSSAWKRYWITFTMGAWATVPASKELWLRARNSTSGRVLDVCGLKLERGNRATDWSPAPEDTDAAITKNTSEIKIANDNITSLVSRTQSVENRVETAELEIVQKADSVTVTALKTEMDKMPVGGINLMRRTRDFSDDSEQPWLYLDSYAQEGTYKGFTVLKRQAPWAGVTQSILAVAGEEYTFSAFVKKTSAAGSINFYGDGAYSLPNFGQTSKAGTEVTVTTDWARVSITFTVTRSGIIQPRFEKTTNTEGSYMFVCGLKLERGNKLTDWTPAPTDPAQSVKTSSVTVDGSGIRLESTGEITLAAGGKINIQSGADEGNQILLGDLFSATDQGGVTGKTANFDNLLVGGIPAATLGGNLAVSTAQPSGHGILWLKPSSVATVQYQRATPSTRSWWLNGVRVIESLAAKTTDVLPGGTIHYKLVLPLYALSRLNGVIVAAKLSKSGITGDVALTAQTISILGLNVVTLEGESTVNLGAAPGTPITLTLTVTNGDGQKLFVQSDTTIQLEISNRTAATGGVQALEAFWIP